MGITKDTLVRGHTFDGATGMKTGADLEDLVTRATLAAGTELLDGVTLEAYLDGVLGVYRARVKAGSIGATQLAAGALMPAGAVLAFAMETPPTGWLECDGAAVSRSTYATLFSAIGTAHGEGDGSTTFNLPDLRGTFVRGWDHAAGTDPDAATRTAAATGGVTGDKVGTEQADELKAHTHAIALHPPDIGPKTSGGAGNNNYNTATGSTGGLETRPKNIALMYCIKT